MTMQSDVPPPLPAVARQRTGFDGAETRHDQQLRLLNSRQRVLQDRLTREELFCPPEPERLRIGAIRGEVRERTPEEQVRFLKRFWHGAALEEKATIEDTLPYRLRVGWRIVREMARLKNLVEENQLLIEGLPVEPCPWRNGSPYNRPENPEDIRSQKRYMVPLWSAVKLICGSMDERRAQETGNALPGLPLLPPPIDERYVRPDGTIDEEYAPEDDSRLMSWIRAAKIIAEYYSMDTMTDERGAAEEDYLNRLALQVILDPKTCRRAFPGRMQIMQFEELVSLEVIDKLQDGWLDAAKFLQEHYDLRDREVRGMVAVGLTELRNKSEFDVEEKRSLLEHRLNGFIERSKSALDLNNEIKGLKVLSVIQGLTRTEPEDATKEFIDASARVIEAGPPAGIPPLNVVDVPAIEVQTPPSEGGGISP